ncbi:MAG: hypothetical protein WAM85_12520 [Terracidiphilus sp.]
MRIQVWAAGLVLAFGLGTLAVNAQTQNQPQAMPMSGMGSQSGKIATQVPPPSVPLKITFGDKSAEWTVAKLAALPHKTITVYNMHVKAIQLYSGVQLIDLLAPLGVATNPHGKDFLLYLVAKGSDGYQVVYAIAEAIPDVHEATVIVADSMDGKPIANNGPLQLVATGEKHPARWVHNLIVIRVMTAD